MKLFALLQRANIVTKIKANEIIPLINIITRFGYYELFDIIAALSERWQKERFWPDKLAAYILGTIHKKTGKLFLGSYGD